MLHGTLCSREGEELRGTQATFLVRCQLTLFPLYLIKNKMFFTLFLFPSLLYVFARSWPFIWELMHSLDNKRPAGVGSDSVIFIFTCHSFFTFFFLIFFISRVKTLHSWPCGIVSLFTLTNQPINSSNNDQISFALTLTGLKRGNLHLIAPTRKHLNPQKEPYWYSTTESSPVRLPAFDISVRQQPHKSHQ